MDIKDVLDHDNCDHPSCAALKERVGAYVAKMAKDHNTRTFTAADSFTEVEVDAMRGLIGMRIKPAMLSLEHKESIESSLLENLKAASVMSDDAFNRINAEMVEHIKKIIKEVQIEFAEELTGDDLLSNLDDDSSDLN